MILPQLSHCRRPDPTGRSILTHSHRPSIDWSLEEKNFTAGTVAMVQTHPSTDPGLGPYVSGENRGA